MGQTKGPKTCGDAGGKNFRGIPCKRPPTKPDGRCNYHTAWEETGNAETNPDNRGKLTLRELRRIKKLAQYLTLKQVADCMEMSYGTFSKLRKDDERLQLAIKRGRAEAHADAGNTLLKAIRNGNVTAAIYWTKAQMGWRDRDVHKPVAQESPLRASSVEVHVYMPDNGRGDRPGEVEPMRVKSVKGNGDQLTADAAGRKPARA